MSDSEFEGPLSPAAEGALQLWRGGFDASAFAGEMRRNHLTYAARIARQVRPGSAISAGLDATIKATVAFYGRQNVADADEVEQRRAAGIAALDQLETACRVAVMSDEARALYS